jgi:hypothetical protein
MVLDAGKHKGRELNFRSIKHNAQSGWFLGVSLEQTDCESTRHAVWLAESGIGESQLHLFIPDELYSSSSARWDKMCVIKWILGWLCTWSDPGSVKLQGSCEQHEANDMPAQADIWWITITSHIMKVLFTSGLYECNTPYSLSKINHHKGKGKLKFPISFVNIFCALT